MAENSESFQVPQSAIEQMLAECWQSLLQRPAVGLQDNFLLSVVIRYWLLR
nr:hypothetical protein KXZ65_14995 [Pectobacterium sp. PL152]